MSAGIRDLNVGLVHVGAGIRALPVGGVHVGTRAASAIAVTSADLTSALALAFTAVLAI
ncbi:MAG TPA: hypothetical protein VHN14_27990 [Kofleriaceae bacterium]|jgi:hypothetical protein|nr:hypothetical protein [Kofleriaceae bacterium]